MKHNIILLFLLLPLYYPCTTYTHSEEKPPQKPWTVMIYMAASNDLAIFAPRNLAQMQKIGSNETVNIVVHHNTYEKKKHHARTFFIEKGNKKLLNEQWDEFDCGSPDNLISFCNTTIKQFPAEKYALILWNHGSGAIEPTFRSAFSAENLFSLVATRTLLNEETGLPFFLTFKRKKEIYKGICFNDATNKFLTEQHLIYALKTICQTSLNGGRFDIIGFDACFMAMVEIAKALQPFASLMVASQEVEKGSGWNYKTTLSLFHEKNPTPLEFGTHIVTSYAKTYLHMENFTQSCVFLDEINPLCNTISRIATTLQQCVTQYTKKPISKIIKMSRSKHTCTHFDEPEFIDLGHFLKNLLELLNSHYKEKNDVVASDVAQLKTLVAQAINQTRQAVYKSLSGKQFSEATGLSIYFPEGALHSSYSKTVFAHQTQWHHFIKSYLSAYKK